MLSTLDSTAPEQSKDYVSASEVTLMDLGRIYLGAFY